MSNLDQNQMPEHIPRKRKRSEEPDMDMSDFRNEHSKTRRFGHIIINSQEPGTRWVKITCSTDDPNWDAKQQIRQIVHGKYPSLKEYVCVECGKVAAHRIHDMIKHVAIHSPGKYHCKDYGCSCGRTKFFNRLFAVRRHLEALAAGASVERLDEEMKSSKSVIKGVKRRQISM